VVWQRPRSWSTDPQELTGVDDDRAGAEDDGSWPGGGLEVLGGGWDVVKGGLAEGDDVLDNGGTTQLPPRSMPSKQDEDGADELDGGDDDVWASDD
jgi:hypothetical protein